MVICLRVIKNVYARGAEEAEIDHANDAELDWTIPVHEEILDYEPDQVLEKKDHLLELSILLHG